MTALLPSRNPLGCRNTLRRPLEPDFWSLLASTGWGVPGTPHNPVRLPLSVLDPRSAPTVISLRRLRHEGGSSLALTVVYGVLVIGVVCLLALGGLELVERLVPADARRQHNDVAGFIYAALGVIYAVLLALVVIAVW